MSDVKTAKKTTIKQQISNEHELQLAADLTLISLLRETPDIIKRYPELMTVLEVPHSCGPASSLIEKQVKVLRQQKQDQDRHLRNLMDIARDNEHLALIRHNLAINLLSAHDLDEVINIVLAVLRDELMADFAVIKLFSDDREYIEQAAGLFADIKGEQLKAFKTMLEHKNTVCGKSTKQQKQFLFEKNTDSIKSVAIIPLVAGANLGLIGLGSLNSKRFHSSMGTDFLSLTGDLVSAAIAVHLEK